MYKTKYTNMNLFLNFIISAVSTAVAAYLLPSIHIDGVKTLIILVILLGFANAVIRPILNILALPLNIITLGLFSFVISGGLILLVDKSLEGFSTNGWMSAILFGIVLSVVNWTFSVFKSKD